MKYLLYENEYDQWVKPFDQDLLNSILGNGNKWMKNNYWDEQWWNSHGEYLWAIALDKDEVLCYTQPSNGYKVSCKVKDFVGEDKALITLIASNNEDEVFQTEIYNLSK